MKFLKYIVLIIMVASVGVPMFAQDAKPTATVEEVEYKAENEGWLVDVMQAHELSEKTGKPILANFTGSDWCGWCKKLKYAVFDKEEFKTWAEENVILLELDFPRRKQIPANIKQQNAQLQQAFQVRGYPTVWVFYLTKPEGSQQFNIDALGKTGYAGSVEIFTKTIESMMEQYEKSKTDPVPPVEDATKSE